MRTRTSRTLRCTALGMWLGVAAAAGAADVVVVVAARDPASALSRSEVSNIFLGKLSRFPDGRPASPVDQPEGSAARAAFYRDIGNRSPAEVKAYWSKMIFTGRGQPPPVAAGDERVKEFVSGQPGAIGYIERASVDGQVKVLTVQ
jgi:ABC-type phosphate transport system substrate-binding protein